MLGLFRDTVDLSGYILCFRISGHAGKQSLRCEVNCSPFRVQDLPQSFGFVHFSVKRGRAFLPQELTSHARQALPVMSDCRDFRGEWQLLALFSIPGGLGLSLTWVTD